MRLEKRANMGTRSSNLVQASREWATRPADQRFWTLQELYAKTRQYAAESVVKPVNLRDCTAVALPNDDLGLQGPAGNVATFQNYSFGQICGQCNAPASYLRELPAPLAADCLNNGLKRIGGNQALMFHRNGGLHLRCVTSTSYSRIWNHEVAEMALMLQERQGWVTPPAWPCGLEGVPVRRATEADVVGHSLVKVGDEISPAGLYASDRDCFIFQINPDVTIDAGGGEHLCRGVFWSNSEVGDARFRGTMFLFDYVCGNHIIWGAKVVAEISIIHKGRAHEVFSDAMEEATQRVLESASDDTRRIKLAKEYILGANGEEIVKRVFTANLGITRQEAQMAYVLAERHADEHGDDPTTAWGYVAGLTRLSQQQYADKRDSMDRAGGKILGWSF
jgi:hypothetical protein